MLLFAWDGLPLRVGVAQSRVTDAWQSSLPIDRGSLPGRKRINAIHSFYADCSSLAQDATKSFQDLRLRGVSVSGPRNEADAVAAFPQLAELELTNCGRVLELRAQVEPFELLAARRGNGVNHPAVNPQEKWRCSPAATACRRGSDNVSGAIADERHAIAIECGHYSVAGSAIQIRAIVVGVEILDVAAPYVDVEALLHALRGNCS
jgi:hypothetical protein